VRRREPDEGAPGGVPSRLRRFEAGQWPGADIWERHRAWHAARDAWAAGHGDWLESLDEVLAAAWSVPDEPWDPDAI
jgi:hypothetical protein